MRRKLDAVVAAAATATAAAKLRWTGEITTMRLKLDDAEASAAALTAALVASRVNAADEHLHRMRAEHVEAPTALQDCTYISRRRASGLLSG